MKKGKSRLKKTRARKRLKKAIYISSFITLLLWTLVFYLLAHFNKPEPTVKLEKTTIKEVKAIEVIKVKTAKVTAYSCGGLETRAEIKMNCPSLFYGKPKTANGTEPIPYKTGACNRELMGQTLEIMDLGLTIKCTDTFGQHHEDTKCADKTCIDLYVEDVQEARAFGVQYLEYYEVN